MKTRIVNKWYISFGICSGEVDDVINFSTAEVENYGEVAWFDLFQGGEAGYRGRQYWRCMAYEWDDGSLEVF